jgi:hypothetical protein
LYGNGGAGQVMPSYAANGIPIGVPIGQPVFRYIPTYIHTVRIVNNYVVVTYHINSGPPQPMPQMYAYPPQPVGQPVYAQTIQQSIPPSSGQYNQYNQYNQYGQSQQMQQIQQSQPQQIQQPQQTQQAPMWGQPHMYGGYGDLPLFLFTHDRLSSHFSWRYTYMYCMDV